MEVREVHGQGVLWRGCRVCLVVLFPQSAWWLIEILGQMALVDPPIAAGAFISFLVWQLRPTRDCEMKPSPSLQ
jgi:hypothetical protein